MEPQQILQSLLDAKVLDILKFFIRNESTEFYLREISRNTKVSAASTYRILKKLVAISVLNIREVKTAKLYRLQSNSTTEFLKSIIEVDYIDYFIQRALNFNHVDEIILVGEKAKTKANILLLGSSIDLSMVKLLCGEIKENYNYSINAMALNREQYEQMTAMGLYPGGKKVLFKKS
jgi:hypothetical protein